MSIPLACSNLDIEVTIVVTSPVDIFIFLIALLSVSTTYRFPDKSIVIPDGWLNVASLPVPLSEPGVPEPAKVLAKPAGVTFIIKWFIESVAYILPKKSIVIPVVKT